MLKAGGVHVSAEKRQSRLASPRRAAGRDLRGRARAQRLLRQERASLSHARAYGMGALRRQAAAPLFRSEPAGAARLARSARAAGGVPGQPRREALRFATRGAHAVLLSQRGWRRTDLR